MKETGDLQEGLMEAPDLGQFLEENQENFAQIQAFEILNEFFLKKRISKSVLAKRAGMSEVYLHQVFSGKRNPSRSRLICMCIGMQATLEETQELLKLCGCAQLYPKNKRDAIILFGITHGKDLFEINDTLFEEEEETLY